MCGIVAVFGDHKLTKEVLQKTADDALQALRSRGPDHSFVKAHENFLLGACRLHTSGSSLSGAQPALSPCQRYSFCFNGAIYRYLENDAWKSIRSTQSDTDTIGRLLTQIGPLNLFRSLDGMFALIVHDLHTRNTYICRDPLGIKPLYYGNLPSGITLIASDTQSFQSVSSELKLSKRKVFDYLFYGYNPYDGSVFQEVYQVQPGEVLLFQSLAEHPIRVAPPLKIGRTGRRNCKYSSTKLRQDLTSSLDDVLSGAATKPVLAVSSGIDSLALAEISAHELDVKLDTYFLCTTDQIDEAEQVERNMKRLGHSCARVQISESDILETFDACCSSLGDTFGDMSIVPTTYLAKAMSQDGVRIAMGGDGADEFLFGYNRYWKLISLAIAKDSWMSQDLDSSPSFGISSSEILKFSKSIGEARKFSPPSAFDPRSFLEAYSANLCVSAAGSCQKSTPNDIYFTDIDGPRMTALDLALLMSRWDQRYYLSGSILRKSDRAFMSQSIEYRVPYLSGAIISSLSSTPQMKIDPHKSILRNAVRIGDNALEFSKKKGFLIDISAAMVIDLQSWYSKHKIPKKSICNTALSGNHRALFAWQMLIQWSEINGKADELAEILVT